MLGNLWSSTQSLDISVSTEELAMAGKILVVDDNKDMLALLQRIISEGTDHLVTSATDPFKALEILKKSIRYGHLRFENATNGRY